MRWLLSIALWCGLLSLAEARDTRVALVVGHQRGWKGEQTLPWVLSGDVRPVARAFSRLGYRVFRMENPSPKQLRQRLQALGSYVRRHKVQTFLFYYSGHADKRFFHLGPRQKAPQRPLSYREFLAFFLQLPVKRRFAILDACHGGQVIPLVHGTRRRQKPKAAAINNQTIFQFLNRQLPGQKRFANLDQLRLWYSLSLPKGVRRPKKAFDFKKTPFLRREHGAGIQIIGTIGVAWHDPQIRASLLTAHLLRGLRGEADNVKDGRITLEELYNFVQARLYRKGQKLNRFSLFNGNYTLAPNYQSALHLASSIRGSINVSIGQFTWRYQKRDARRIAIPTIHGKGVVEIHRGGKCWRQALSFPKGKSVELKGYGTQTRCDRQARPKGAQLLEAQSQPLPQRPSHHLLSLSVGFTQVGQDPVITSHPAFALGYRHRFGGVGIEYYLGQKPLGKSFVLHRLSLVAEAGLPFSLLTDKLEAFLGAAGRIGATFVELDRGLEQVLSLGLGAKAELQYWLSTRWGLRLDLLAGLDYTPSVGLSGLSFQWKAQLSVLLRL